MPDVCGVWTGTTCPDGFECELDDPNQPDSNGECDSLDPCANGGVCVIDGAGLGEFCGGIAGILCEDGLECELYGSYPDAGGECVFPAADVGELCGGFCRNTMRRLTCL